MADNITILVPAITAVTITPNPATINGAIKITVAASEKTVVLSPEERYSGEFYSGEV